MKINTIIKELLYKYNKVNIPGFGGFEAKYQPSRLDENQGVVYPPVKVISFNNKAIEDDGLLTAYLTEKLEISVEDAQKLIYDFVKASIGKLKMGDRISFDDVGTLSGDLTKNIIFKPRTQENLLLESYGLEPIKLPPAQKKKNISKSSKQSLAGKQTSTKKNYLKYVFIFLPIVAILVLVILFFSEIKLFTSQVSDKLFKKETVDTNKNKPDTTKNKPDTIIHKDTSTLKQNDKELEKKLADSNLENITEIKLGTNYKKYYIIVGSFSQKGNAENKVAQFRKQGFDAEVLPPSGVHYRVSVGGFQTVDEILAGYNKFRAKNPKTSVWILKNK